MADSGLMPQYKLKYHVQFRLKYGKDDEGVLIFPERFDGVRLVGSDFESIETSVVDGKYTRMQIDNRKKCIVNIDFNFYTIFIKVKKSRSTMNYMNKLAVIYEVNI